MARLHGIICQLAEKFVLIILQCKFILCGSQWPRGLRRGSAAARLLRSWVRIPPGAWMFVYCECCVLSGRGLCDDLITRPEESYRLWCVVVCDLEISRMRRPWPALGRSATEKKARVHIIHYIEFKIFNIPRRNVLKLIYPSDTIYGPRYRLKKPG